MATFQRVAPAEAKGESSDQMVNTSREPAQKDAGGALQEAASDAKARLIMSKKSLLYDALKRHQWHLPDPRSQLCSY